MSALQQTAQPSQLEPLLEQVAANQNLQNLLASLPDRTRRSVMVPFGAVAFFPGADVIAEKSTTETVNVLKQRQLQLEAQVTALRQQQPAVQDSRQQAGIAAASQVTLQSPEDEDEEHMLDIREPYDEHFHGDLQLQTSIPSKHMQPQVPQAVLVTGDEEPKPWLQQAHVTDGVAAGGAALDTNGLTAGVAAGGAAGGAEESNTLQQQACATDDGEFEKMMARFDDRERQEAAADGRASATGASGSTPHPTHVQQQSQQQQRKATVSPPSTPSSVHKHHVRPLTGLKRGFLSGKASRPNSKASLQSVRASSAGQGTSGAGQSTSRADQGASWAGQGISSTVESQLQHDSADQSSKTAFTGSIVERLALSTGSAALDEPPVNVQQRSSGTDSPDTSTGLMVASSTGQVAQQAAPKKISKFKQSRNAK